jgi:hypothetical protein
MARYGEAMPSPEVPPPAPGALPIDYDRFFDPMDVAPHRPPPPELDDPAVARNFRLVAGAAAGVVAAAVTMSSHSWAPVGR